MNKSGIQAQVADAAFKTMVEATAPYCLKILDGARDLALANTWANRRRAMGGGVLMLRTVTPDTAPLVDMPALTRQTLEHYRGWQALATDGIRVILECPINERFHTNPDDFAALAEATDPFVEAATDAGFWAGVLVTSEGNPPGDNAGAPFFLQPRVLSLLRKWRQLPARKPGRRVIWCPHGYSHPPTPADDPWHFARPALILNALPADAQLNYAMGEMGCDGGCDLPAQKPGVGYMGYFDPNDGRIRRYADYCRVQVRALAADPRCIAGAFFLSGHDPSGRPNFATFDVRDEVDFRPVLTENVPGPAITWLEPVAAPPPPREPTMDELKALARPIAARHRIDWAIAERQVQAESSWNPRAVSRSGAKGLLQLMDATAADLGVTDPFDPAQNLEGGWRFLRMLLDRYGQSYVKALVAYNWGPGNLDRLLATKPPDWRAVISQQARDYLVKIRPPEDAMAAGNDGPRTRTIGAVVHSTRSSVERDLEQEADATAAWMMQGAPNPSCHKVISPTRAIAVVPKPLAAWHARDPLNQTHLGYELAQPFADTPYHPGQYKILAKELIEDARAYGFPLVHVASGNTTPGYIGHEETANGRADGKSDPGPMFDWALLEREITALIRKPFNVETERAQLWAIKDNLAANGWPRFAQAIEAAVTQSKGEQ